MGCTPLFLLLSSRRTRGATLVEYGLLAGLVGAVGIGAVLAMGTGVEESIDTAATTLASEQAAALAPAAPTVPAPPATRTPVQMTSIAIVGPARVYGGDGQAYMMVRGVEATEVDVGTTHTLVDFWGRALGDDDCTISTTNFELTTATQSMDALIEFNRQGYWRVAQSRIPNGYNPGLPGQWIAPWGEESPTIPGC